MRADRRPLAGHEQEYEITQSGWVWSLRLGRFIKHAHSPHGTGTYIRIVRKRRPVTMSVPVAVVASWLEPSQRAQLREVVPQDALRNVSVLRLHKSSIDEAAQAYGLPKDIVFRFLAAERAS